MFYSQCLLSRKGPLGAIWVAAYCHKRLKKTQVAETDISSSVEKILVDDFPTVACRVLGYLLLGVVRIYSMKVEYLFDDCHKVLIEINDFTTTKMFSQPEEVCCPPLITITLPDTFELDAFDLENLENLEDLNCNHVRPQKDITLEGGDAWKNEIAGHWSFEKGLHLEDGAGTSPGARTPPEHVRSPSAAASLEKLQDERIYPERFRNKEMLFSDVAKSPSEQVDSLTEEHHSYENQMDLGEASFSAFGTNQFPPEDQADVRSCHLMDNLTVQSPPHDLNVEATLKKLQENSHPEESPSHVNAIEGSPGVIGCEEHHMDNGQLTFTEMNGSEKRKQLEPAVTHKFNIAVASGSTTPDLSVPTPAKIESARIMRKRKCLLDEATVLPNKELRRGIENAADLICKRRRLPHTVLEAWRSCYIPMLLQDLSEPLLPYCSSEIRSIFSKKRFNAIEPDETAESIQEFPRSLEQIVVPPEAPVDPTTSTRFNDVGSSAHGINEDQSVIAPATPVDQPTARSRKGFKDSDRWGSMISSSESLDSGDQELDLNLNQEVSSSEVNQSAEDIKNPNKWSLRTREVADYLRKRFRRRTHGKTEFVSLFKVSKRKPRKEAARLFYEILVLKSDGFVDVRQTVACDDILVLDVSKL